MKLSGKELFFDRVDSCDWCDKETDVAITQYETSPCKILICRKCAERIKKWDTEVHGYNHEEE